LICKAFLAYFLRKIFAPFFSWDLLVWNSNTGEHCIFSAKRGVGVG
jgi:hypothetical protein